MDASRLFAVEYHPRQQDWRIDTLDKVLKANYEFFLGVRVRNPFVESDEWILLGVCSSLEEAQALADKFQEIKDGYERDIRKARNSYIVQFPGSDKEDAQK